MNILGIIPARGGSKGVPGKNIRLLGGRPLIDWTIKAAQESKIITNFAVSTDSKKIADIAVAASCETIDRPAELGEDKTPMLPVLQHAVNVMEKRHSLIYDYCIILQPTTPFRTGKHIDEAFSILMENDCDSVVSVYKVEDQHPARMYKMEKGLLVKFSPELEDVRRQELPEVFHRNGMIYAFKRSLLISNSFFGKKIVPFVMDKKVSINIDDEMDLEFANYIISKDINA